MSIEVIRGSTTKPAAMDQLVEAICAAPDLEGTLWVGFPLLNDVDTTYAVDALLLSPAHGIVIFDVVEGTELDDHIRRQEDLYRLVQSKLLREKNLARKGILDVGVEACTFAPAVDRKTIEEAFSEDPDYRVLRSDEVQEFIFNLQPGNVSEDKLVRVKSALQNLSTLRKRTTKRSLLTDDSRGAKLHRLENSIATLDKSQSEAVLQVPDGVQRIRGLAGSGKTVVLALKAAYLHAANPDWKIAVTFNVRSLKQQFKKLIQEFHIAETGESPDWSKIQVVNSWGSPASLSNTGIYAEYCKANEVVYQDFRTASNHFGGQAAFDEICKIALSGVQSPRPVYDAILVDEAQDFAPSFLRICYQLLTGHKRLVYAYDELQNLSSQGMPSPQEIFGVDQDGKPLVSFEASDSTATRRDILLERCYRNSRPILSTAHAFGFGVYRNAPAKASTGLVQMFNQTSLWNEIGYEADGILRDDEVVTLRRTENTSPLFLENHSDLSDLISIQAFSTVESQYEWVAEEIRKNLQDEELQPNDIMVVNPDPITARKNFGPLRNRLLDLGIDTHLAGVDTSSDTFFSTDARSVTCTGIYRAKGNEAGMVYVINAHEGQTQTYNLSTVRNRLFVAITRSKAWVRVTGVAPDMDILTEEFSRIRAEDFALKFRYPTQSERETLRIVHRELTGKQHDEVVSSEKSARDLVERLRAGNVHAQDLDPNVREQLLELLRSSGEK